MIKDRQVEGAIATLLRGGVMLAAAVVLLGGILYLGQRGVNSADYHVFRGEPLELRSPAAMWHGAVSGQAEAIIQIGVLLLILTPVARVLFSVFAFGFERDWMYVGMTLIVLAVLVYSLLGG